VRVCFHRVAIAVGFVASVADVALAAALLRLLLHSVVTADNQSTMARQGGLEMLVTLLRTPNEATQRQAAKALANLGVNGAAFDLHVRVCVCVVSCRLLCSCRVCVMGGCALRVVAPLWTPCVYAVRAQRKTKPSLLPRAESPCLFSWRVMEAWECK
jgi:hypothetical protein